MRQKQSPKANPKFKDSLINKSLGKHRDFKC